MAEGVVSAPFLPSSDQGRKGGFAPLSKQHSITCRITNEIPNKYKPFQRRIGRKTRCMHRNFEELGARPDKAEPSLLADIALAAILSSSRPVGAPLNAQLSVAGFGALDKLTKP
jgi:hypothetical protein